MKTKLLSIFFCLGICIYSLDFPTTANASSKINIEILYMNHGPMQPTIRNLKKLLIKQGGKVAVQWFDADLASGKNFMKKKNIHGHIPMLIFINGKKSFYINGKSVTFQGFPTGASPFKRVEGNWSISDLNNLLRNIH